MVFYDENQTMGTERSVSTHKKWYSDQTGKHYTTKARAEQAEIQSEESLFRIYAGLKIWWDSTAINIVSMGYYRRMEDHFKDHQSDCEILISYSETGWGYCIAALFIEEDMEDIAKKAIRIARKEGGYAFRDNNDSDGIDGQMNLLDDFWLTTD